MKLNTIASLVFILIVMSWGCGQNAAEETENTSTPEAQIEEPAQTLEKIVSPPLDPAPSGEPDEHGRLPGDEHYGHAHAPEGATPAAQPSTNTGAPFATGAPAADGPDKFGRNPGDEHYGHDHE